MANSRDMITDNDEASLDSLPMEVSFNSLANEQLMQVAFYLFGNLKDFGQFACITKKTYAVSTDSRVKHALAQVHPNLAIPLSPNDSRVTPEFSAFGLMHQVGNLIWSGVPKKADKSMLLLNWHEAKAFFSRLGGVRPGREAKLPSYKESQSRPEFFLPESNIADWENPSIDDLSQASPLVDDCLDFWTSTQYDSPGLAYSMAHGSDAHMTDKLPVRGVVRLQNASPDNIYLVSKNHPDIPPAFASSGSVYRIGQLFWSGIPRAGSTPVTCTRETAQAFISELDDGTRLPSNRELEKFAVAFGQDTPSDFNLSLFLELFELSSAPNLITSECASPSTIFSPFDMLFACIVPSVDTGPEDSEGSLIFVRPVERILAEHETLMVDNETRSMKPC